MSQNVSEKKERGEPRWAWYVGLGASVVTIISFFLGLIFILPHSSITNHAFPMPTPEFPTNPYYLAIPGPCGLGDDGQWKYYDVSSVKCTTNGLQLTRPAHDSYNRAVDLLLPPIGASQHYPLSQDYTVSVEASDFVNFSTSKTCAGLSIGQSFSSVVSGGYAIFICQTGIWQIINYAQTDGSAIEVSTGNIAPNSRGLYEISIAVQKDKIIPAVEGVALPPFTAAVALNDNVIGLLVDTDPNELNRGDSSGGSVLFHDFYYQSYP